VGGGVDLRISEDRASIAESTRRLLATDKGRASQYQENASQPSDRLQLLQMLDELGLFELDVVQSSEEAVVAFEIVRECGFAATTAPVVPRLAACVAGLPGLLYAVRGKADAVLLNHTDLNLDIHALDIDGNLYQCEVLEKPPLMSRPSAPYASRVRLHPLGSNDLGPLPWSVYVSMCAVSALGAIESVRQMSIEHVSSRIQFGQPLSNFQGIRNRIAEIVIKEHGLRELCNFTVSRLASGTSTPIAEALILRHYHLKASKEVFSSAHQLHGALGLTYEYPLFSAVLSAEFDRLVPLNEAVTSTELCKRWGEIELHYEELPSPWNLRRTNRIMTNRVAQP
jgi:hypothetical protein